MNNIKKYVVPTIVYLMSLKKPIYNILLCIYLNSIYVASTAKKYVILSLLHMFVKFITYYNNYKVVIPPQSTLTTIYHDSSLTPQEICNLTYRLHDQIYNIRFPKSRGPSKISKVVNIDRSGEQTDITELFENFAGPCHNFYTIRTTPKMLGYETLLVTLMDDSAHIFNHDDPIVF